MKGRERQRERIDRKRQRKIEREKNEIIPYPTHAVCVYVLVYCIRSCCAFWGELGELYVLHQTLSCLMSYVVQCANPFLRRTPPSSVLSVQPHKPQRHNGEHWFWWFSYQRMLTCAFTGALSVCLLCCYLIVVIGVKQQAEVNSRKMREGERLILENVNACSFHPTHFVVDLGCSVYPLSLPNFGSFLLVFVLSSDNNEI